MLISETTQDLVQNPRSSVLPATSADLCGTRLNLVFLGISQGEDSISANNVQMDDTVRTPQLTMMSHYVLKICIVEFERTVLSLNTIDVLLELNTCKRELHNDQTALHAHPGISVS